MKNRRFQHKYRKSTSRLHRSVGSIIRHGSLSGNKIYQEYPVNLVNPHYPHGSHKFDWVLPQLKLVIECHGKQHYDVVDFGGQGFEKALEAFKAGQSRDGQKREAALSAGYTYVVIPYTDSTKISEDYLFEKIQIAEEELERYTELSGGINVFESPDNKVATAAQKKQVSQREARERYLSSSAHLDKLERAREYRREQYRRQKEWKKACGK